MTKKYILERCSICKFVLSTNCRRYPPVITPYHTKDSFGDPITEHYPMYPDVNGDGWCGEFKEKELEDQI